MAIDQLRTFIWTFVTRNGFTQHKTGNVHIQKSVLQWKEKTGCMIEGRRTLVTDHKHVSQARHGG